MEFIVKTDLSKEALSEIDFNYNELKGELSRNLARYEGMTISEADIPSAKSDLAMLRKLNMAMDDERKRIKKQYMTPYTEFEAKVKELQGLVAKPISEISTQIEGFNERRKAEKTAELKEYYLSEAKGLVEYVPWERVFNPRWGNITYSMEDAKLEIRTAITGAFKDIETLTTAQDFELYKEPVLAKYRQTGDIREAIAYLNNLQSVQQERDKAKAREKSTSANSAQVETPPPNPVQPKANEQTATKCSQYSITITVTGTREQLDGLAEYMYKNGIGYKRK